MDPEEAPRNVWAEAGTEIARRAAASERDATARRMALILR
jgi:hypothetical protein